MSAKQRESTQSPPLFAPLFAALLATLLLTVFCVPAAFASPKSDQKAAIARLKVQADKIYMQISAANEELNAANERYAAVESAIAENTKLLGIAKFNLAAADQSMESRLIALYKQQEVDFLDVLLTTQSFDELVGHMDALKKLNANDIATIKSIEKLQTEISDRAIKLEADKKAAKVIVAEQQQKLAARKAIEAKVNKLIAGHEAQIRRLDAAEAQRNRDLALQSRLNQNPVDSTVPAGDSHSEVANIAAGYQGVPYVYGGASPAGFDCSGLTMYCYAQVGIGLPHNAAAQQSSVASVPLNQVQAGDLIFFGYPAYHVGIYWGGGQMIHAPHSGTTVQFGSIAGASGAGRP